MELYTSWRLNYSTISCLQEQRTAPCVNCDAPKHSEPFPCFKKLQIPIQIEAKYSIYLLKMSFRAKALHLAML